MTPRVWFKSISPNYIRSFESKEIIYFTQDGTDKGSVARWNVILGDNGTGKTTVLKGLATLYYSHFLTIEQIDSLNRHRNKEIQIDYELSIENYRSKGGKFSFSMASYEDILKNKTFYRSSTLGPGRNYRSDEGDLEPFILGYGASRKIDNSASFQDVSNPAISLFDEDYSLINAEKWLIEAEYISLKNKGYLEQYSLVKRIILKLFAEEIEDIRISIDNNSPLVYFKTHYGEVRLHELSLGYKTLIAWMVDFAKGLLDKYPDSINPLAEPAVCLVDEIDLHLHPKFQRQIIQFLTEIFPNTQFIVTAHSPLIVQSAEDYGANLILLKREGDHTVVVNNPVDVHTWRLDQILSSELFGGIAPRPPKTEAKIERRRELIRKQKLNKREKEELQKLEEEITHLPVLESKEAIEAMEILKKAARNLK